jgi:KRAB domain-containing zinc finger protein
MFSISMFSPEVCPDEMLYDFSSENKTNEQQDVNESTYQVDVNLPDFTCSMPSPLPQIVETYQDDLDNINENEFEKTLDVLNAGKKRYPFDCHLCCKKLIRPIKAISHYHHVHDLTLCKYCLKCFDDNEIFESHVDTFHRYRCDHCDFTIVSKFPCKLKTHMKLRHRHLFKAVPNFKCKYCEETFRVKHVLKNHVSTCHSKYLCSFCMKYFIDKTEYEEHLDKEEHHLTCKLCGAEFGEKHKYHKHYKTHHKEYVFPKKSYKCMECKGEVPLLSYLKRHYLDQHELFYCAECIKTFPSHDEINSHCLEIHGTPTNWSFVCEKCNKYFDSNISFKKHVDLCSNAQRVLCDYCGKEYVNNGKLKNHIRNAHLRAPNNKERICCELCGKNIIRKNIALHMKRHAGIKDVQCPKCPCSFFSVSALKCHTDQVHKMVEKSKCPTCLRRFDSSKLEQHVLEEHVFEWSYICNYCQIYSLNEDEIQQHCSDKHKAEDEPKFTRTSPYQCETCFMYLANAAKLKRHKYIIHFDKDTGLKVKSTSKKFIVCEICGEKQVKTITSLKYHKYMAHQIPLDYKCNQCDRSYLHEHQLTNHVARFHAENRNHVCDVCSKRFRTKKHMSTHKRRVHKAEYHVCEHCNKTLKGPAVVLRRHMEMHFSQQPWRCEICDRHFSRNAAYQSHMQRHRQNKPIHFPRKRRVEALFTAIQIDGPS